MRYFPLVFRVPLGFQLGVRFGAVREDLDDREVIVSGHAATSPTLSRYRNAASA